MNTKKRKIRTYCIPPSWSFGLGGTGDLSRLLKIENRCRMWTWNSKKRHLLGSWWIWKSTKHRISQELTFSLEAEMRSGNDGVGDHGHLNLEYIAFSLSETNKWMKKTRTREWEMNNKICPTYRRCCRPCASSRDPFHVPYLKLKANTSFQHIWILYWMTISSNNGAKRTCSKEERESPHSIKYFIII